MKSNLTNDSYQGFFTNANDIKNTMLDLLGDVTDQNVIEPCFGEGSFIKNLIGTPQKITAIDIDEKHFEKELEVANCQFYHLDFIDYFIKPESVKNKLPNIEYDSTICNPPYGLKYSKEYREVIKKSYPDIHARESYAMFFYFTIQQLKNNGRYVFILPDSFLTSTHLRYLREFIVKTAKPTHIIQFKSKRFESVKFAYSNMCIIAGNKTEIKTNDKIEWIDALSSEAQLIDLVSSNKTTVNGDYFIDNVRESWVSPAVLESIGVLKSFVTLEDIAECRTGIYTGNNERFCGFNAKKPPRRANGHAVDWDQVLLQPTDTQKQVGIERPIAYVPFIRGGHRKVFEETSHCIRWDIEAVSYYDTDKKARLQNKVFYFKKGLAVPMVTSGKLTASEMDNCIFDQGVVGVFAINENYHNFLLIYLNDDFSTKLKLSIAPGANNSANYLKKLRIPKLQSFDLEKATEIIKKAKKDGWEATQNIRNTFIKNIIYK